MEEKHLVSNRTDKFTWLENKRKVYKKEQFFSILLAGPVVFGPTDVFLTFKEQISLFNLCFQNM
jgi:hypothetical protein